MGCYFECQGKIFGPVDKRAVLPGIMERTDSMLQFSESTK